MPLITLGVERRGDSPLASGHIVEDMGLAVDLAAAGRPTVFVPGAEVAGEFPSDERAAGTQRRRWEHGHLKVILSGVPRLLLAAARRGRLDLLVLALEIGVPPLSALALVVTGIQALLVGWALLGGPIGPPVVLAAGAALASVALLAVWARYGRTVLPARALVRIPGYAVRKVGLYLGFVTKPQHEWVRTARQ